jgi:hypothetical protein
MTTTKQQDPEPQPAVAGPVQRRVRRQRGEDMPMSISRGAVLVNNAFVERDFGDCVLVSVDLHSKYAELAGTSSGSSGGPCVYLHATEHSLHLDAAAQKDAATTIEFHDLVGWRVFSSYGPARYTLDLTLVAPDA